jgi:hypothetical protein
LTDGKSVKFDKVLINKKIIDNISELNTNNTEKIIDENNIELAPDIIELKDTEKFKDENNQVLYIETHGIRNLDSIFFRVKDISEKFNIKRLNDILLSTNNGYEVNIHYKYYTNDQLLSSKKY